MSKGKAAYLVVVAAIAGAAVLLWWWTIQGGAGNLIPALAASLSAAVICMVVLPLYVLLSSGVERLFWPRGVGGQDDLGQAVWFGDPRKMPTPIHLDRDVDESVNKWMRANQLTLRNWLQALAGAGLIAFCFIIVGSLTRGWYSCFLAVPAFLLIPPLVLRPVNAALVRWRGRALIAIGRCPSCGYDLTRLPIESDRCVICPECGAAWRRAPSPPGGAGS